MKNPKPSLKNLDVLFLSGFGAGLARTAPGTLGSLLPLPFLYYLSHFKLPVILISPLLVLMTLGSMALCDIVQRRYQALDPSWIVMDEVIGMIIAWCFFPNASWWLLVQFALFRFFDILKIWPISWVDRNMKNGFGVFLDDILAGIFAGILTLFLANIFS